MLDPYSKLWVQQAGTSVCLSLIIKIWNTTQHIVRVLWLSVQWKMSIIPTRIHLLPIVQLFATPWTAAPQASLSFTISLSLLKLMSTELVMPFNHLILCRSFSSFLQSFPASGSFPLSQFFASDGQSIGVSASASVLPMKIQDWFPLGLTGLISLLFKGLSRVFTSTTIWEHQFFVIQNV